MGGSSGFGGFGSSGSPSCKLSKGFEAWLVRGGVSARSQQSHDTIQSTGSLEPAECIVAYCHDLGLFSSHIRGAAIVFAGVFGPVGLMS